MGPASIDGAREQRNSLELHGQHLRHYSHHPGVRFISRVTFCRCRLANKLIRNCLAALSLPFGVWAAIFPSRLRQSGRKPTLQEAVCRFGWVRVRAAALSSDRSHCPVHCRICASNRPSRRLAEALGFRARFGITLASGAVALVLLVFWVDEPRRTIPLTIEVGARRSGLVATSQAVSRSVSKGT